MAAPTLYKSTDGSAPTLSGTAGDLVNLLDKCLVDGYGAKSGAGWTKAFTATNQRSYRMGGGNQLYLDVDDRGATSVLTGASGKEAAVRGYEVMTAVSTGTNPFPTTAQIAANSANWRKSSAADATLRAWFLIADDRSFVLGILDQDSVGYKVYYFGDIYSLKSGDGFRTIIYLRITSNSNTAVGSLGNSGSATLSSAGPSGLYAARVGVGSGTSINAGLSSVGTTWEQSGLFASNLDGNIYLSRLLVADGNSASGVGLRGWLRGCYEILTPVGLNDGDTFTGSGDFAGRNFVVVRGLAATAAIEVAIETTAWDTSS